MPNATILIAENNTHTLSNQIEKLHQKGYSLIATNGRDSAEAVLEGIPLDGAVFDIRLKNDDDDQDFTGMELAREASQQIPKFIYSDQGNFEKAQQALNWPTKKGSENVEFIAKGNGGLNTLVQKLEERVPVQSSKAPSIDMRIRPMMAFISLFLTLLLGGAAIVFAAPWLLVVTVGLAILSAVLMSKPLR